MIWALIVIGLVAVFIAVLLLTALQHAVWRVPYVPTSRRLVGAMVELARLQPRDRVYDLGAGDARLLIAAKKREPKIQATGYEGAFAIWALGRLKIFLSRVDVSLRCKNFLKQDLSDATVIFLYLSPEMMERLARKFDRELERGTRVISNVFQFKNRKPTEVKEVRLPFWGKKKVCLYSW